MRMGTDPRPGSRGAGASGASAAWLIRNAKVLGRTRLVDISIQDGLVEAVGSVTPATAAREVDAGGRIVLPGLVDAHMHLDKAWLGSRVVNRTGTYDEAARVMALEKQAFTPEDIVARAVHVIRLAVARGTTAIRSHVDVDRVVGLTGLRALLAAKREVGRFVDIDLVPICRAEIVVSPAARRLVEDAIREGVRALGGTPRLAMRGRAHLRWVFEMASSHNVDIDLHVDETEDPRHLMIRDVLDLTERHGYQGRVTVGHLCSLGVVSRTQADPIIRRLKELRINVVALPASNLFLQGRGRRRSPLRGLTRVKDLLAAGVNVSVASDNVRDAFCPYGTADLFQAALLLAHAAQFSGCEEWAILARMMTEYPSRILWPPDGRALAEGQAADLVICDATTASDLILSQPCCLFVFKAGRLVVQSARKTVFEPDMTSVEEEMLSRRCASL